MTADSDENPIYCDIGEAGFMGGAPDRPMANESAVIVILGATGDLARRKIVPALYNLARQGLLHGETRIIGFARRGLSDDGFRDEMREACNLFSRERPLDEGTWTSLAARMSYVEGDLDETKAYSRLAARLIEPGMPSNQLFYLAVTPDRFGQVAGMLALAGLTSLSEGAVRGKNGYRRVVVEKPFGVDRASARELNIVLQRHFAERDIFRIDHYLGKETVQNLLYFRFANSIFEPLWNRNHIERVEIDVFETGGIGSRGGYYDGAGAARDMLQNHLVQLLCLAAMEPPSSLSSESIREEKAKVLRGIPDYIAADLVARSVRGQYGEGIAADGARIPSYRAEAKVAPGSETETFVSLRVEVDNWRFAGVPFILRTGKALDRQVSEIRVVFKRPPAALFALWCGDRLQPNVLTIRIQPDEGMWLAFNTKLPGASRIVSDRLRFAYRERHGDYFPEAYERLISDALAGDPTLFIRADEAEEAWRLVDALRSAWAGLKPPLLSYPAGSAGPR